MTADSGADMRDAKRWSIWVARGISYLVYGYLLVVEVILVLGFILLLFGANPDAAFTEWAYRSLERAMQPFRGIFTPIELGTAGANDVPSVFETSVVFAMIVYGILAIALGSLIDWLSYRMGLIDRQAEEDARRAELEVRQAEYEKMRAEAEARLTLEQQEAGAAPAESTPPHTPPPTASPGSQG